MITPRSIDHGLCRDHDSDQDQDQDQYKDLIAEAGVKSWQLVDQEPIVFNLPCPHCPASLSQFLVLVFDLDFWTHFHFICQEESYRQWGDLDLSADGILSKWLFSNHTLTLAFEKLLSNCCISLTPLSLSMFWQHQTHPIALYFLGDRKTNMVRYIDMTIQVSSCLKLGRSKNWYFLGLCPK